MQRGLKYFFQHWQLNPLMLSFDTNTVNSHSAVQVFFAYSETPLTQSPQMTHHGPVLLLFVDTLNSYEAFAVAPAAELLCRSRLLCVITHESAVGNSSCILEQSGCSNQLDVIPHLSHRLSVFLGILATSLNGRRWLLRSQVSLWCPLGYNQASIPICPSASLCQHHSRKTDQDSPWIMDV